MVTVTTRKAVVGLTCLSPPPPPLILFLTPHPSHSPDSFPVSLHISPPSSTPPPSSLSSSFFFYSSILGARSTGRTKAWESDRWEQVCGSGGGGSGGGGGGGNDGGGDKGDSDGNVGGGGGIDRR